MKNFRCLLTALMMALFVSTAATAGEIQGVGSANPGDTHAVGCSNPGEIQGVGCSAPSPGGQQTPGLSASASTSNEGFDNVSIGARIIAELLSAIF